MSVLAPPASRRSSPPTLWRRVVFIAGPSLIWAAYWALLLPYLQLRSYGDELLPWLDGAAIETAIFRFNAPEALQTALYPGNEWLDFAAFMLHMSWFFVPVFAAIAIMVFERTKLMEFCIWILCMAYVGNLLFFLFPLEPPWMDAGVSRVLSERQFIQYARVDNNPVAAFPSFHAGIPLLITLFFLFRSERLKPLAWVSGAATLFISVAVVYLGEHWLIDVAGGWILASVTAWLLSHRRVLGAANRFPGSPVARLRTVNRFLCLRAGQESQTPGEPAVDDFVPGRRAA